MTGELINTGILTTFLNFSNDQASQWNIMTAVIITLLIPVIIISLFIQKFIFSGIINGTIKELFF